MLTKVRRYPAAPDKDLRWVLRNEPLFEDFDEVCEVEEQVIARVLRTGSISCEEVVLPNSDDSWRSWSRRNPVAYSSHYTDEVLKREQLAAIRARAARAAAQKAAQAVAQAAAWAQEQRERYRRAHRARTKAEEQRRWDEVARRANAQWQTDTLPPPPEKWPVGQVMSLWSQKSRATVAYWNQLGFTKEDDAQKYALICIDAPLFMITPARAALDMPGGILFVPADLADYLAEHGAATRLS